MYLIDKEENLGPERLAKILANFQTTDLVTLKRWKDYYDGKQDILLKKATDTGKPCNKIVVNYCYNIVKNYLGYITGIPIAYSNDDFQEVLDILNYNDVSTEDNELLKNALIYGVSYEINYVDEEGKQRFKSLEPTECVPVFSDDLNNDLLYVIRFWKKDRLETDKEEYKVEVYSKDEVIEYTSTAGFTSFKEVNRESHYYGQCPITIFYLNSDHSSVFKQVMSLQDAYNELFSGEIDDFDSFADAYLVLKGAIADKEDLDEMKKNRVLMLDSDASAEYLTKSISDTQIANMLQNSNDQIHKLSNSPDFNDEKFMAQSGVAMRYKLLGLENEASNIETSMRKALTRRIELISAILTKTDGESIWRDIDIRFTRNLPLSLDPNNMTIQDINSLRGLVSDETLIGLLPFIKNIEEELKRLQEEKEANIDLYNIGNKEDGEDKLLEE